MTLHNDGEKIRKHYTVMNMNEIELKNIPIYNFKIKKIENTVPVM